jgi:DMSO/TMAO reductase YedYZ molybdopterin-dependent catalytic subunit
MPNNAPKPPVAFEPGFFSLRQRATQGTGQLPVGDWPIEYREGWVPQPNLANFRLTIDGSVRYPLHFSYEDLLRQPLTSVHRRLYSHQGWSYKAHWQGILLKTLLDQAQPLLSQGHVVQTNLAGEHESFPLSLMQGLDVLLCLRHNGQPLHPAHGGPARMLVFSRYSYKGLMQLSRLQIHDIPAQGLSHQYGYPPEGAIQPGSYYAFDAAQPLNYPESGY